MGYYDGHSVLHLVGFILEPEYLYFMGANGEVSADVVKGLPDSPPPCAPLFLSACLPPATRPHVVLAMAGKQHPESASSFVIHQRPCVVQSTSGNQSVKLVFINVKSPPRSDINTKPSLHMKSVSSCAECPVSL
jgi:hypothetical protein